MPLASRIVFGRQLDSFGQPCPVLQKFENKGTNEKARREPSGTQTWIGAISFELADTRVGMRRRERMLEKGRDIALARAESEQEEAAS